MTTFAEKLRRAELIGVITEAEGAATGGTYFDEGLGLWLRQDADGGGIMPFAYQMDQVYGGRPGKAGVIETLFLRLGRTADIVEYDKAKRGRA